MGGGRLRARIERMERACAPRPILALVYEDGATFQAPGGPWAQTREGLARAIEAHPERRWIILDWGIATAALPPPEDGRCVAG
jgi:hypothetical protein